MRNVRFLAGVLFLAGLAFVAYRLFVAPQAVAPAALSVQSLLGGQSVKLNGQPVGETPFYSDKLPPGDVDLVLGAYSTRAHLSSGTLSVVNRGLSPVLAFDFGEKVWLEEGETSLVVLSQPDGATVALDGLPLGQTPLTSTAVSLGEHDLVVSLSGHRPSRLKIKIQPGYRLYLAADLMLVPVPEKIVEILAPNGQPLPSNLKVYDLSLDNPALLSDPASWVRGIVFWQKVEKAAEGFAYFVDSLGSLYDREGEALELSAAAPAEPGAVLAVGYLGGKEPFGLTAAAQSSLSALSLKLLGTPPKRVKILPTGTGWLRIRQSPSRSSEEMAKADVGRSYPLLEEQPEWVKIDLGEGKSGWVFKSFVRIEEER